MTMNWIRIEVYFALVKSSLFYLQQSKVVSKKGPECKVEISHDILILRFSKDLFIYVFIFILIITYFHKI